MFTSLASRLDLLDVPKYSIFRHCARRDIAAEFRTPSLPGANPKAVGWSGREGAFPPLKRGPALS